MVVWGRANNQSKQFLASHGRSILCLCLWLKLISLTMSQIWVIMNRSIIHNCLVIICSFWKSRVCAWQLFFLVYQYIITYNYTFEPFFLFVCFFPLCDIIFSTFVLQLLITHHLYCHKISQVCFEGSRYSFGLSQEGAVYCNNKIIKYFSYHSEYKCIYLHWISPCTFLLKELKVNTVISVSGKEGGPRLTWPTGLGG